VYVPKKKKLVVSLPDQQKKPKGKAKTGQAKKRAKERPAHEARNSCRKGQEKLSNGRGGKNNFS